jgi:hypothetical protein
MSDNPMRRCKSWNIMTRRIAWLAVAAVGLGLTTAPAQAGLLGASVDVTFNAPSLNDDYGAVTLNATGTSFDTAYGYVTVSATQIIIAPPSYVSTSYSYGTPTSFVGFIFTYGTGATVTGDSFDSTNTVTPAGVLNLFPTIGVNLTGDTIDVGQAVVLDVTGTYAAPPSVPEPPTFALLATGAAIMLGLFRRRATRP